MKRLPYIIFFVTITLPQLLWAGETIPGTVVRVSSPDRQLVLTFYQKQLQPQKRAMYYHLERNGKPLVLESLLDVRMDNRLSENAMALKVDEHADWCENLVVEGIRTGAHDSTWTPLNGESATVRDQYNYANVELKKDDNPIYEMHVQIRVYNQGAAIRYYLPENPKGTYYNITDEKTEFSLPEGTMAWVANWAQAPYQKLPLHNWPGESERPLTVELPGQQYLCLAEAGLVDYARTKYKLSDKPSTIVTSMFGEAQLISPIATPWRAIIVADHPGGLIENNSLLLNLNEACRIKDTGWIQPGKIMRVMTQTTVDARANIDFAAQQKLQYILFDWKWYGPAFSFQSDATHVAIPDFNLPDIIDYARQKGIGVWLYVNQQALLAQSDSLFRIYQRWGVKGVKFGFVQSGSHRWTTWIEKAIRQAADSHVMVNIHDDWRPTGEQRTWPNLMTAEGIKGNEEMPDATHNTILPFTRYIAGPADYTICYFDHRIKTTHAHQLALAAIYYSPIQTLFWYDHPSQYHQEPELEFWSEIPTTWDETRIIQGMPGEYITTARRKGTEWFVGTITNNEARSLKVALSFLTPGKKYKAKIYSDDSSIATATHVRVGNMLVNSKTVLSISLQPSGGEAMQLEEIK